jgi:flagellar hook-associated protein 2
MAISSLGVGSGLDLNALVDGLLSAERTPVENRLNSQEGKLQTQLSAFGVLSSSISSLQSALTPLKDLAQGRVAKSSDPSIISVTAGETAAVGNYSVVANQTAMAESLASTAFASSTDVVGEGSLTFSFGTTDYDAQTDTYNSFTANPNKVPVTITIDSSNNTLEGIRDAVNSADFGVTAVIVNDGTGQRLLFSSDATGAENSLEVTVSGDSVGSDSDNTGLSQLAFNSAATNLQQTVAAQDAQITVNGLAITSSSNTFTDSLPGLTLEIEDTSASPVNVSVDLNKAAAETAIRGFVKAYNELNGDLSSVASYNAETGEAGILLGDSFVRGVGSTLRNHLVSSYADSTSPIRNFIDLGIKTKSDGTLSIDSETLTAALADNYDAVIAFANAAGDAMDSSVSSYLGSDGLIKGRQDSLQQGIERINDQRDQLDLRLSKMEQSLRQKYSALDTLLAGMQSTSNFITTQLASLDFSPNKSSK